jgi:hypothetical protein
MSRFFLLTLALFACDGDAKDTPADTDTEPTPTTFTVSVTLTDLDGEGLVLSLNGEEHEVSGEGTFTFPTALASGANYDVQVVTQPTCPAQRCRVTGGFGTIPGADITGVEVSCGDPRLRAFTHSWGDDTIRVTDDVLSLEEDEVASPRLIAGPATALTGSALDSLAWDTRRNILYVVTPDAVLAFPDADSLEGDVAPARVMDLKGAGQMEGIEIDAANDRAYVCGSQGLHIVADLSLADGEVIPVGRVADMPCNAITRDEDADRLYVSGDYDGTLWSLDDAEDLIDELTPTRIASWTPDVDGFEGPTALWFDDCEDRLYVGSNWASPVGTSLYAFDDADELDGPIDPEATAAATFAWGQAIVLAGDGTRALWVGEDSATALYRYTRADRWEAAVLDEPERGIEGLISSGYGVVFTTY